MAKSKTHISSSIANTSKSALKMIGEATRDVLEESMPNLSSILSGTASESSALLNNMISKSKNLFSRFPCGI